MTLNKVLLHLMFQDSCFCCLLFSNGFSRCSHCGGLLVQWLLCARVFSGAISIVLSIRFYPTGHRVSQTVPAFVIGLLLGF